MTACRPKSAICRPAERTLNRNEGFPLFASWPATTARAAPRCCVSRIRGRVNFPSAPTTATGEPWAKCITCSSWRNKLQGHGNVGNAGLIENIPFLHEAGAAIKVSGVELGVDIDAPHIASAGLREQGIQDQLTDAFGATLRKNGHSTQPRAAVRCGGQQSPGAGNI